MLDASPIKGRASVPTLSLPLILSGSGLIVGFIAAVLMYYFPPRVTLYTKDGAPHVTWIGDQEEGGERKGAIQAFLSRAAPWLLAAAFLLQFLALIPSLGGESPRPSVAADVRGAKDDYEMQERCSKRMAEQGKPDVELGVIAGRRNHYNRKLNKCVGLLWRMSADGTVKSLVDVNEWSNLANFNLNKSAKVPHCNVGNAQCQSEKEWDALVKPYMEE